MQPMTAEQLMASRRFFEDLLTRRETECETYMTASRHEQELWSAKRAQLTRLADIDHAQREINRIDAELQYLPADHSALANDENVLAEAKRFGAEKHPAPAKQSAEPIPLGSVHEALVVRIEDAAAILTLKSGEHGALRLREIAPQPIGHLHEYLKVGDVVRVKVIGKDDNELISLTMNMTRPIPVTAARAS